MTRLQLREAINKKKAEARRLNDACLVNGEYRAMSDEEKKAFEAVCSAVKSMEEMYAAMEEMGLDEEDVDPKPEKKSLRVSQPMDTSSGPAVHTRTHRYSLQRAIRLATEGQRVDGLEGEVSQYLARSRGKKAEGFLVPTGIDEGIRSLLKIGEVRADVTTTTNAGSIFVLPELPFIELLRNKIVLQQMGCTMLTGMEGKFSIPRRNGANTAQWIAEGTGLTSSATTADQVPFVDKTLGAASLMTRKFIYQTSVDAERFVQEDLAAVLAIELDRAAINGNGSGATPIGILQNSTVQAQNTAAGLSSGTNGGAPTWANVVLLETTVAAANADMGKLAYLASPKVRGLMKVTPKIGTTFPVFLWEKGDRKGIGDVNSTDAWVTNNVPSNLTKASGSNLSALIYGNWADLFIALWGGVDMIVNPYTNQLSGGIQVSMLLEADIQLRHPESFAFLSDIQV